MAENTGLVYKGRPLMRKDNMVYYGSMADKYIVILQILESRDFKDLKLASKVSVQLQLTDPSLRPRERVVKKIKSLFRFTFFLAIYFYRILSSSPMSTMNMSE